MTEMPANVTEIELLRKEIERLNKIVEALVDRTEEDENNRLTDFGVFHASIRLENQVRSRTQELEEALLRNEKITRALNQAKMQIEQNEQHLHDITASLGEGLMVLTAEGLINFINLAACKLLGWSEAEVLGKNSHDLFHHSHEDGSHFSIKGCKQINVAKTKKLYTSDDDFYWRKDGTKFPISIVATPIKLQDNTTGVALAFRDITKTRQERDWLRLMQAAIEHSPTSVMITDNKANIIYSNPQVTKTTGYSKEELLGRCTTIFQSGKASAKEYEHLWKKLLAGEIWRGELLDRRKDGSLFWEALSVAPVTDNHGVVKYFVSVSEDVTEKRKMQSLLHEMSFHDALTGIANRRRFDEYFDLEWRRSKRTSKSLSIIMADLDFFKQYNDRLGHQAGDECLKRIAKVLESRIVRAGDLLARYGGEEFVFILPQTDLAGAKLLANEMRKSVLALKIPHPESSISKYVTISLGIATTDHIRNASGNVLLHTADQALYRAKSLGRNRVEVADIET
ncbi:MAG TPA: diguanylate cyclase [Alphaproteobacteria bacterium]|nr:diguanylate cyclase [Alphaproteobacteria bacterium]